MFLFRVCFVLYFIKLSVGKRFWTKLYISCLSLSSRKSGRVSILSVTPAGISASSSLHSSSGVPKL